jgi:hydroxypyruvate isomerase
LAATTAAASQLPSPLEAQAPPRKGRLKQGCMRVNFDPKMPFEDVCREAAARGILGFDLIAPQDWPTLRKYGLVPSMANTGGVTFENGLIRKDQHEALEKSVTAFIDQCAAAGVTNMISVGGQRRGMSYEEGMDNAAAFLNRVKKHAEDKGVTICLEIMNSKFTDATLGRVDQICDHADWAFELMKRVNSPRIKVLFDIYHVQVADGDVAHRIKDNIQWIGHFHTGGVPGRNELDDTQELNYHFIAKTIADLGYTGFVSHEYRPSKGKDPLKVLEQVVEIMTV